MPWAKKCLLCKPEYGFLSVGNVRGTSYVKLVEEEFLLAQVIEIKYLNSKCLASQQ